MPKCCGKNTYDFAFCPHCGKPVEPDPPLVSLLAHVRWQARVYADRSERFKSGNGGAPNPSYEKSAKKWASWVFAMTEIVRERHGD